ncbi:hypothetical protein [Leifsonia shinshuensis]
MSSTWTHNGISVNGVAFRGLKGLIPVVWDSPVPPASFVMYQVRNALAQQVIRKRLPSADPVFKFESSVPAIPATLTFLGPTPANDYQSLIPFALPKPALWKREYTFGLDGAPAKPNWPRVYSALFGKTSVSATGAAQQGGVGGSVTVSTTMVASVDPVLIPRLVTGARLAEYVADSLTPAPPSEEEQQFLADQGYVPAFDSKPPEWSPDQIDQMRSELSREYSAPASWETQLHAEEFFVSEGEQVEIEASVTVSGPGRGYYAIEFTDAETGESQLGEPWAVQNGLRGIEVLTDFSRLEFED